jgi:NitT/TauT family transport system substrate-binding protein
LSNTVRIGYFPNISHSQAFVETTLWINGHQEETEKVINGRLKALVGRELPADVVHEAFSNMQVTYDPMKLSLVNLVDEVYELGMLGREKLDLSGIYYATLLNEVLNEKNLFVVK